jgi:sulfur carrier protein ThiS
MPVRLILKEHVYELEGTITVKDTLKVLHLSPQAFLLVRSGVLLNDNEILRDGDEVKIVAVISGG